MAFLPFLLLLLSEWTVFIYGFTFSHKNHIPVIFECTHRSYLKALGRSTSTCKYAEKEDTTNFASYMASRKDKILGSSEDDSTSSNENTDSSVNSGNKKRGGMWKIFSGSGANSSQGKQLVQPISLDGSILKTTTSTSSTKVSSSSSSSSSSTTKTSSSATSPPNPPSLLQQDIMNINQNYDKLRASINDQFEKLRKEDPTSIPENSDEILNFVLEQQKQYDLMEKKQQREQESFLEYENRMRKEFELKSQKVASNTMSGGVAVDEMMKEIENDPLVQEIMKEATEMYEYTNKQNDELLKFQEYEASVRKSMLRSDKDVVVDMNTFNNSKSFDELQLEILEDLLEKRKASAESDGFDDEDIYVTDNIEDGIEELQKYIESGKGTKSYKPQSMKEWQIYRAIATKLAKERLGESEEDDDDSSERLEVDKDYIQKKVAAWKEYVKLEEEMRRKSGLTIEYRPPFEWSNKPDQMTSIPKVRGSVDPVKSEEARTELDNLALKVLNDLMEKTKDPSRQNKLKQEIQALKDGIKARQEYLKRRPPPSPKKKIKPIMINEILRPTVRATLKKESSVNIRNIEDEEDVNSNEYDYEDDDIDDDISDEEPPPPDSMFFRELRKEDRLYDYADDEDIETEEENTNIVSLSDYDDEEIDLDDDLSLGSLEQQRFRSLVARSGVRTIDEQNELRKKWEEFQEAEKKMREISGLSSSATASVITPPKVSYDPKELFKPDGDIDFDKILSSIGSRPSRKNKNSLTQNSTSEKSAPKPNESEAVASVKVESVSESNSIEIEDSQKPLITSKLKNDEVKVPDLFGIDGKGEAEKKFLKGQYAGFERRKADLLEYPILSVAQINSLIALKTSPFETGVSPYLARMNKPFKDFGAIFSLEGVLVDITGLLYEAWKRTAEVYNFPLPDIEDMKFAAVHSFEYSIQKVFYWTDDVLLIRQIAKSFKGFLYTVLDERNHSETNSNNVDISEVNTASNSKKTSSDPDISEEDILQIQHRAWERAARSYGFEPPSIELMTIAGTMEPTNAIRTIFRWSKDFVICNDISKAYRKYLKRETDKFLTDTGIIRASTNSMRKKSDAKEVKANLIPTYEEVLIMKCKAWEKAINNTNIYIPFPNMDDVRVAEFAGPERAMTSVFKWNLTQPILNEVLLQYRKELRLLTEKLVSKIDSSVLSSNNEMKNGNGLESISTFNLKSGVIKWLNSLRDVYVPLSVTTYLDQELADKILEETGLSEYFPGESRVYGDSGYDTETQQLLGAALRIDRRPDHCVTFSSTPQSASYAHEVEMKNIAIVSPYPYYELTSSDSTVRDFDSLGVMNLKNVFSEVDMEPMQQLQVEEPLVKRKTMLKTRFWDDGDR